MARRIFVPQAGRSIRSPRRATDWGAAAEPVETAVAGNTKVLLQRLTAATILQEIGVPATVVRTRGQLYGRILESVVADTESWGAMGMAIVTEQAAVAGAASLPGPLTESFWDGWFVYVFISVGLRFDDATGVVTPTQVRVDFDSKAMRKIEDNESLVVMFETGAASNQIVIMEHFRTLLKKH